MSLYASLVAQVSPSGQGSIMSRLLTNHLLLGKIDTKKLVDAIFNKTQGEDKAEGYRLLCLLLTSDVQVEEAKLSVIFERLPSLIESIIDDIEGAHVLELLTTVYKCGLKETIDRIEKNLGKIVNTCIRLIQSQKHKADLLLAILETLLTSSSRNLMQQQFGAIRKAWY